MPLIELETFIAAPPARVFDLSRSIEAHLASAERSGERAIGGRTSGLIEKGETVTWEARHFGMKQRLTVRVTEFDHPQRFADEMITGAFASMHHLHHFTSCEGGTLMRDEFRFSAPLGILGRLAEVLFLTAYLRRFLETRAEKLKELAESEEWRAFLAGEGDSSVD